MTAEHWLYLGLDLGTLLVPFLRSFESKYIDFKSKWKGLFIGIGVVGFIFVVWDILFTINGVWGFNNTYLTGFYIGPLPIEEWLFFVVVPYACLFVYEVANRFLTHNPFTSIATTLSLIWGGALLVIAFLNTDHSYTFITFTLLGALLIYLNIIVKPHWMANFYRGYFISLFPFLLVNGVLTGSFIEAPVVWYNNVENLGIRLFTIPIEDTQYMLLLLLGVTWIYEHFKAKKLERQV